LTRQGDVHGGCRLVVMALDFRMPPIAQYPLPVADYDTDALHLSLPFLIQAVEERLVSPDEIFADVG
jgi:hypothetical protein